MKKKQERMTELTEGMIKVLQHHKDELFKIKIKVIVAIKRCTKCEDNENLGRLQHASDWLGKFVNGVLRDYRLAEAYHSKDEWFLLKQFDGDQPEELILKESLRDVKSKWRTRPNFFKNPTKKKRE